MLARRGLRNVIVAIAGILTLLLIGAEYRGGITQSRGDIRDKETSSRINTPGKNNLSIPLIVYNRVDKCGGRSLLSIMRILSKLNGFTFSESAFLKGKYRVSKDVQLQEIDHVRNMRKPAFFTDHFHFIDFEKYGVQNPVYINLIRDPIDHFVSLYNFQAFGDNRGVGGSSENLPDINDCVIKKHPRCSEWSSFHLARFFCGQDVKVCKGAKATVKVARKRIDEKYQFVGITEEFDTTLKIFENILPEYFSGAIDIWNEIRQKTLNSTKTIRKMELSPQASDMLRQRLSPDYEIYNHVKTLFNSRKRNLGIG